MLDLQQFENIEKATGLTISPDILWMVLLVAAIIFGLIGITLIYHWLRFSFDAKKTLAVTFIYVTISILLLAVAFISVGYYQIAS